MGKMLELLEALWGLTAVYTTIYLSVNLIDASEIVTSNQLWNQVSNKVQSLNPQILLKNGNTVSLLLLLISVTLLVMAKVIHEEVEIW